jgi:hypothetical protein
MPGAGLEIRGIPVLHLIKLSVGTEDVEDLAAWQSRRRARTGRAYHRTRMTPRRREELLDGGSIYWVIKGQVRARQLLLDIEAVVDDQGRADNHLILGEQLVRTVPRKHRPFQGWRYLAPEDAPPDLDTLGAGLSDMPAEMAAKLHELGLL